MKRKGSKLRRIEGLLKKYRNVDSYLLNKYSRKIYTHADLDKLEEMFENGIYCMNFEDDEDFLYFYSEREAYISEFQPLNSKRWGGLPHYTAIRRAINNPNLRLSERGRQPFEERFDFWVNECFEMVFDKELFKVYYYELTDDGVQTATDEDFKNNEDVKELLSDFKYNKNNFNVERIEDMDDFTNRLDFLKETRESLIGEDLTNGNLYFKKSSSKYLGTFYELWLKRENEDDHCLTLAYEEDGRILSNKKSSVYFWKMAGLDVEYVEKDLPTVIEFVEEEYE